MTGGSCLTRGHLSLFRGGREREGVYHKTRGKGRARAVRSFVLRCCKFRSRLEHFSAARGLRAQCQSSQWNGSTDARTDVASFNLLIGITRITELPKYTN